MRQTKFSNDYRGLRTLTHLTIYASCVSLFNLPILSSEDRPCQAGEEASHIKSGGIGIISVRSSESERDRQRDARTDIIQIYDFDAIKTVFLLP